MAWKRHRGTAIVETEKGILVASGKRKVFLLPGGGTNRGENRQRAACRELREETGLHVKDSAYLFSFVGESHKAHGGGHFQDHHKVFIVKAEGVARPRHEIKHVAYYHPESGIRLSSATKEIIEKYYEMKKEKDFSKYLSTTPTVMERVARAIKHFFRHKWNSIIYSMNSDWERINYLPRRMLKALPDKAFDHPERVYFVKGRHYRYKFQAFGGGDPGMDGRPSDLIMRKPRRHLLKDKGILK